MEIADARHTARASVAESRDQDSRHGMAHRPEVAPCNPQATALRMAGLRVTSARMATLRAAPAVLEEHGYLSPPLLREACQRLGYTFHLTSFYNLLPALAAAGLIPAHPIRRPARHRAEASMAPTGDAGPAAGIDGPGGQP